MATTPTQRHGESKGVEPQVIGAFELASKRGNERLTRSWRILTTTGFLGGVEIAIGALAYLGVVQETDSRLLGGLAFSIGLIAVHLAHSELFTEDFYYPIMALVGRTGSILQLVRLWGTVLAMNMVGGALTMLVISKAFPEYHELMAETARHFVDTPFGWKAICLAMLGGAVITLLTRMHTGSDSDIASIAATVAASFLLAGFSLFHCVLDSVLIFGAMWSGAEGVTILGWLSWFWSAVVFNTLGGLLLVTAPRVLRSSELLTS